MSTASQWIKIDPVKYDTEQIPTDSGVEFKVFLSPYDIPEAVRGFYDVAKERFTIQFKYIGNESTETVQRDGPVTFRVGIHSGRLHAIEVDVHSLGVEQVGLRIAQALEGLTAHPPAAKVPFENYEVTRSVVGNQRARLLRSLATA